jgi:aromatic ring-opening dioxygenase catalytic subunit (LigB family)
MRDLTDEIKKASATLVISHHDPTLVINDSLDYTQFFETNGTTNEHPFPSGTITSTTHWEGERLVTEYTISSREKLVYTYTVLPTKQMVLRVRRDSTEAARGRPEELKLVYNLASSEAK